MEILATIQSRIPESLSPEESTLLEYITKWKEYIAPLLDPEIPATSISDDTAWGTLPAELIVSLVIYEVLDMAIKNYLLTSMGSSSSGSSGVSGLVKKVVTGPAEAEFFSPKETMSEVMKPGGMFSSSKESVCLLSHRLGINLIICSPVAAPIVAPRIYKN